MPHSAPSIVLFAHGSRDPLWRAPIEAVAAYIRQHHPERLVRCAYLECCAPTLAEAASELIAQSAQHVCVIPMFLGTGRHAREDLPALLAQLQAAHPAVRFTLQPAIGEDPRVTALLAAIACESPP
ncbi:MAG: sirohydrochlorin chelatase [Burkholderiaceae bacterium]|jgi:Uncharacterized conserved protein|nr:CbiX/SirB N-terminal domain-containing protein [Burkholderiaceae bacterium]